jgi:hypothetical protein
MNVLVEILMVQQEDLFELGNPNSGYRLMDCSIGRESFSFLPCANLCLKGFSQGLGTSEISTLH